MSEYSEEDFELLQRAILEVDQRFDSSIRLETECFCFRDQCFALKWTRPFTLLSHGIKRSAEGVNREEIEGLVGQKLCDNFATQL